MLPKEVDDVGMVQRLRTLEWCLILEIRHIDIGYTMGQEPGDHLGVAEGDRAMQRVIIALTAAIRLQ